MSGFNSQNTAAAAAVMLSELSPAPSQQQQQQQQPQQLLFEAAAPNCRLQLLQCLAFHLFVSLISAYMPCTACPAYSVSQYVCHMRHVHASVCHFAAAMCHGFVRGGSI
jgi:hypothetical protein